MRPLSIGLLAAALVALPLSAASASEFHHHRYGLVGGVFGLAGAVVVGVATIVTAPIVILADALSGGHRYYQRDGGYYGRGSAYDYEGSNNYTDPRGAYSGGPEYRYPPRRALPYPPQAYAPSQAYYPRRSQS